MTILNNSLILVAEDQYLLAVDLAAALHEAGAIVLGPEPTVARALTRIMDERRIDAAVLDVSLGANRTFIVAEALAARRIPYIFLTGYDARFVRKRFPDPIILEKPVRMDVICEVLQSLVLPLQSTV